MKKERYYLIDLFKILSAICIVMIHTIATGGREGTFYTFLSKVIYGFPVPFFFVCSGFLLGEKILKKDTKVKSVFINYLKRLIVPLIFWCLISMFFVFDFNNYTDLSFWFGIIKQFFLAPWCAMWYVMSLIIAIVLIYPLVKKEKYPLLMVIALVLFFLGLLSGNYYFVIKDTFLSNLLDSYENIFLTTRNGLFYGFPFVSCGIYIAYYKKTKKVNYRYTMVIGLLSLILLISEVFLLRRKPFLENTNIYVASIIFIPCVVLYLTKYKNNKPDFSLLGKYSVGIYFTHQFINYVYKYFTNWVGIKLFFAVLLTSFLVLVLLYKINNKYINKVIS